MSAEKKDAEAPQHHKHGEVDAALEYLDHENMATMTEVDEARLVRKIDYRIVPLMWACYNLQYLDKTLINYANVMGLQQDTSITGDQFSLLALVFYVSYLAFEFPTGYLMQRLPTAKYLGANVMIWGLMVACTSAAHNWGGLVALRVLLGVFESAVAPALILITTMWYKQSEQPPRVALWYVGTGTGTIIGALTSFGFQHYSSSSSPEKKQTFTSWQVMFLLFGLVTITVGVLVVLLMPDSPMSSSALTREEKIWAIERLRGNKTGVENKRFKPYQVAECFRDPQTWLLSLITIASNVPNGAVSSYQATIIKNFGYTSKQTALLAIPSGAVSCVSVLSAGYFAGRLNMRAPIIVFLLLVGGVLGGGLVAFLPADNKAGKLAGNYLTNCIGASLPMLYSFAAANYAGHTKKVTMNAIMLMSFCVGNIIGPLTFRDVDKPDYVPAKITIVVTSAFSIVVSALLVVYYRWENTRRDKAYASMTHMENSEFFDLTDRENKEFRYRY